MIERVIEYPFNSIFYGYVERNGSEIGDRKCLVDHAKLCDMKCHLAKINYASASDGLAVQVSCSKFMPAVSLRVWHHFERSED